MSNDSEAMLTFGGHLEVLRKMLFRIAGVIFSLAIVIFIFKDLTFDLILAPSDWNFVTYRAIEDVLHSMGSDFAFDKFHVDLIATDLSSQFMTHISTSLYLGLLLASPYIVFELYGFVAPALLESERKYSTGIVAMVYMLFVAGVLMSYYVLFPVSFRFLGTYSVASSVHSMITLDSYISSFVTLTLMMGLVFQLPVIAYVLARIGILQSSFMVSYRRHALLAIMLLSAIITPPDVMSLILVAMPLYMLYEISIHIVRRVSAGIDDFAEGENYLAD